MHRRFGFQQSTQPIQTLLIALMVLTVPSAAHAMGKGTRPDKRPDTAIPILNAFQNGCSSIGAWTGAAQAQSLAIINIINTIKETSACKPFASQLLTIQSLTGQLTQVMSNSSYLDYRKKEEELQQLTLALDQAQRSGNFSLVSQLTPLLVSAQIELAQERAQYDAQTQTSRRDQIWSQSSALSSYLGGMLLQAQQAASSPTLGDCLQQSPGASIQLGMNVLSYAGSFISPVYGAATSILGQLINNGVEAHRQDPYARGVFKAQSGLLEQALPCALESMTEFYCAAQDSQNLVNLQAASYTSGARPNELWKGLDLLGRRMPSLTRWLDKVRNGVPPQDPTQAARQNAARRKLEAVDTIQRSVVGVINEDAGLIATTSDSQERKARFTNMIEKLLQRIAPQPDFSNPTATTPFSDFESENLRWTCWLINGFGLSDTLCGLTQADIRGPTAITSGDYIDRIYPTNVSDADVAKVLENWAGSRGAVDRIQSFVFSEFSRTISTNVESLLASGFEAPTPDSISPYQALLDAKSFVELTAQQDWSHNPRIKRLLQLRLDQLKRAIWFLAADDGATQPIADPTNPTGPPIGFDRTCPLGAGGTTSLDPKGCDRNRLTELFLLFDLKDGIQVFLTDIQYLVSWDLKRRLDAGEFPTDVREILLSAGLDIGLRMQSAGIKGKLADLVNDLNGARGITQNNIATFRTFFAGAFQDVIESLDKKTIGEPSIGTNRQAGQLLGRVCTLWLITSDPVAAGGTYKTWQDQKMQQICSKATYFTPYSKRMSNGFYTNAISVANWEQGLANRPFSDRFCTYHRFRRSLDLEEILNPQTGPLTVGIGSPSDRGFGSAAYQRWARELGI
jgi:hypothetical protein